MRIISFCADGIRDAAAKGFFDWVTDQDADVICIQGIQESEYKLTDPVFFPPEYNAYFYEATDPKENGVAIYTRQLPKAIMTGLGFNDFDMEGRYIQADFDGISIGCILAPSAWPNDPKQQARKNQFFDLLYNHLNKVRNKRREFIICGNWNIAHRNIDIENPDAHSGFSGCQAEEQQWMERLFKDLGYVDAFRVGNTDSDEFTWWPENDRDTDGLRFDYQIVSNRIRPTIEYGITYKAQVFGSHAPVIIDYDYELPETKF